METNEIMTNEIEETTENVESKKISPATSIVAGLAIVGTYYVVTKAAEFTKSTIRKIKAKRASMQEVIDDIADEDIFEEE